MAHTTTCPACGTTFRVTAGQLLAKQGDVRCGRCGKVFNAHQSLTLNYPPPPPEALPGTPPTPEAIPAPPASAAPEAPPATVATLEATPPEIPEQHLVPAPVDAAPSPEGEIDFAIAMPDTVADSSPAEELPSSPGQLVVEEFLVDDAAPVAMEPSVEAILADDPAPPTPALPESGSAPEIPPVAAPVPEAAPQPESDPELDRLAAQLHAEAISARSAPPETPPTEEAGAAAAPSDPVPQPESAPPPAPPSPPKPLPRWLLPLGSLALLGSLILQSAVYFRTELIAYNPASRPLFEQLCGWLACRVGLPQNPDLLSIETSSLEAEAGRAGIVALSATLRNRAGYAQGYPLFELTLTDYQDKLAARRIFQPQEYLPKNIDPKNGMPANEEIDVKLHLDLGELQAAGYRVYLFYSATTS